MGLFDSAKRIIEEMYTKKGTQGLMDVEKMKACRDIEGLIDFLKHETITVTIGAAQIALGEMGEPALEPLLQATNGAKQDVQKNIIGALGYMGEPALTPLREMLQNGTSFIQTEAASALGDAGEPGVDLLIKILKDEEENKDIRLAAAFGLQTTDNKAATDPLIELLEDKNHWIRAAAVQALATKSDDERAEKAFYEAVDDGLIDSAAKQEFDHDYSKMLKKSDIG